MTDRIDSTRAGGATRVPRRTFVWLFVVSGFSGLIYQSIWSHYLKLFLGHAAYAQALVLVIFMGGLAVGSWLAARHGQRWRAPLLAYAVVEAIIGVLALLFHDAFTTLTQFFYLSLLPGLGDPTTGAVLKWSAAALLMLPQTILLGMTFPLMTAGMVRRYPDQPGQSLALLYFSNSIGAAVGVLASGFLLIGWLGLPGTIRLAGLLNIALASAVFLLLRRDPEVAASAVPARHDSHGARTTARLFLLAAFLTGVASFIYEIAWIRMLSLVLGGTTHSFELMLSAFITGLALGSLWVYRRIDSIANPLRFAAFVQVTMGVLAVLSIPVYGASFDWMAALLQMAPKTDRGYLLFATASHAIALAVMLPATIMAGMTLPVFTAVMLRDGAGESAIGRVYAANTLGAIAGVAFAMQVGLPVLGVRNLIGAGALIDVGLGLLLLSFARIPDRPLALLQYGVTGLGTIALVLLFVPLDPLRLASGVFRYAQPTLAGGKILFYRDGRTASIAVTEFVAGRRMIATNGKPDASIQPNPALPYSPDERTMVMAAALALAYQPDARVIANIGFGSGLTTHTLLADSQVERVDSVEIEPAMVAGARLFGARVARAYDDPRSVINYEDAKTFFSLEDKTYDVIISEPSNPWVSGVASLFSAEFYALARRHLTDDGILVQWLGLYDFNDALMISVLKALAPNFDDFVIYSIGNLDGILVARKSGPIGLPDLDRVFKGPMRGELARVGLTSRSDVMLLLNADRARAETLFRQYDTVPANSDYFPYVDQHAARARFKSQVAESFAR